MISTVLASARAVLNLMAVVVYTVPAMIPLTLFAIGKLLAPSQRVRDFFHQRLIRVVEFWSSCNNFLISRYRQTKWDTEIPANLDHAGRYMVACNHLSWVDILALQKCFNRRLPVLTFFIKHELIYVPLLGFAWWAMDYPFMRRYSRAEIARNPSLAGKDLERARVSCERLREMPFAMMSFPEGTRFTQEKREKTNSPYRHLLKPKVGGTGVVMYALGDRLNTMIDVTIVYPSKTAHNRAPGFLDLLMGRIPEIIVRAREVEIPKQLLGRNFRNDRDIRRELEEWINQVWREKDELIKQLRSS